MYDIASLTAEEILAGTHAWMMDYLIRDGQQVTEERAAMARRNLAEVARIVGFHDFVAEGYLADAPMFETADAFHQHVFEVLDDMRVLAMSVGALQGRAV